MTLKVGLEPVAHFVGLLHSQRFNVVCFIENGVFAASLLCRCLMHRPYTLRVFDTERLAFPDTAMQQILKCHIGWRATKDLAIGFVHVEQAPHDPRGHFAFSRTWRSVNGRNLTHDGLLDSLGLSFLKPLLPSLRRSRYFNSQLRCFRDRFVDKEKAFERDS